MELLWPGTGHRSVEKKMIGTMQAWESYEPSGLAVKYHQFKQLNMNF